MTNIATNSTSISASHLKSKILRIPLPDDWHVHFREGDLLPTTLAASGRCFGRCVAMPNLKKPLKTAHDIAAYSDEITKQLAKIETNDSFAPLLTMYMTDDTKPQELEKAAKIENFFAVKCYPKDVTTNSSDGVSDLNLCMKFLEKMQEMDIPLLIHGESSAKDDDVFDREKIFIDKTLIPLRTKLPNLRITMEHISSKEAAQYLREAGAKTAATITPQHLWFNRNHLLGDGIMPHLYCKPILKREEDRKELLALIKDGVERAFLGSDSAPHTQDMKETACGCAGVYSASYLIEIVAEIFERMGLMKTQTAEQEAKDNPASPLANFVAINGARFYGYDIAKEEISLEKKDLQIPEYMDVAGGKRLVPLGAGETIGWSIKEICTSKVSKAERTKVA